MKDQKIRGEKYFLQGLSSAKGGLSEESCPYPPKTESTNESNIDEIAEIYWKKGWRFGKFILVQTLRKEKFNEIKAAIAQLNSYQNQYSEWCRIENAGFLKSGFKYFSARRGSNSLARHIRQSKEHRLLQDVWFEFYIPWRPSEDPYMFRLIDRRMDIFWHSQQGEIHFQELVNQYGDSHGVRAAWQEYLSPSEIESPPFTKS